MGRFLQPDPIGYGDGLNIYNYVGGDPVNFRDPSGLFLGGIFRGIGEFVSSFGGALRGGLSDFFGGGGGARQREGGTSCVEGGGCMFTPFFGDDNFTTSLPAFVQFGSNSSSASVFGENFEVNNESNNNQECFSRGFSILGDIVTSTGEGVAFAADLGITYSITLTVAGLAFPADGIFTEATGLAATGISLTGAGIGATIELIGNGLRGFGEAGLPGLRATTATFITNQVQGGFLRRLGTVGDLAQQTIDGRSTAERLTSSNPFIPEMSGISRCSER